MKRLQSNTSTEAVREAIYNSLSKNFVDWKTILETRATYYLQHTRYYLPEIVDSLLLKQEWEETTHPNVATGNRVFIAKLGGYANVMLAKDLPEYALLTVKDGCTWIGCQGVESNVTYLITTMRDGHMVVLDFHPGEPIIPTSISLAEGTEIPAVMARYQHHIEHVKVRMM